MTKTASPSTELFQAFEAVPDLYLILSPDFTMLTASKPYLKAALTSLDKIQGRNVFEVFPDNPDFPSAKSTSNLRHSLEWTLLHKQPHKMALQRYDIPMTGAPGRFEERYWSTINTPVLNAEGKVAYIILKTEDITERVLTEQKEEKHRKQLEQLYGEQEKTKIALDSARGQAMLERMKLHNLFMQAPAMICIFEGPQHVFKHVNPPYQQLVGDRPLLGKPIAEAMPELAGQPIFALLDKVYQTGEVFHAHEMKVQLDHHNSGSLGHNYYNFIYQPVRNLEGEIYGIMVFAYEVTAQVESRQEVEKREKAQQALNKELQEANQRIQAANAELSHTQRALQKLNQELEQRVADRTRELELSKAAVETQRNLLHTIFMNAPTPFVMLNGPEQIFQLVNPSFQQIFPGREIVGKPLLEALPELADTPLPGILDEVYNSGKTFEGREYPLMLARHEGAPLEEIYFDFTYQAHRDEQSNIVGVLVFAHDVSAQVKARQVVEQSANQLKLITDALPVLIGYLDKEEKYCFTNKAYEKWFPMKAEELIGRPVREIVGDTAYQGVKQYIDRALAGERLDFESRMPYREDFVKYIRTSYVPDVKEGEVVGFYTLVSDITEQVEGRLKIEDREKDAQALTKKLATTNEELTTANEQLVRTNIDLDNFIYTASHDLKAPIYNIEGLVNILLEAISPEVLATEELDRVKDMIEGSISRFKRTIEHLTEVIKLQKENNQETVEVLLQEVINDVALDLAPQLEAAGAQLNVAVDASPAIRFSQKNLRSVVYNLLSNAIKYSSPDRRPEISISSYTEGRYVVLEVKDNGLGMSKTGRQKLFSMFGRLHDHVEGSGIGLYMVKKIVENAEGHIEVESEADMGSTFRVYFKS
ncbi:MAG: PAS domain-containing protein [Hymenobacteraceae bacterium]|nr:PAS domain-containing protein [Hymenobacteraceae bacterium]MDX5482992.1 PAS domain-containing protein [Hymenobacteraceae bacterium]